MKKRCNVISGLVVSLFFFLGGYAFGGANGGAKKSYGHHRSTASNGSGTFAGQDLTVSVVSPSPTRSYRALAGVSGVVAAPYTLDGSTVLPSLDSVMEASSDSSRDGTQTSQSIGSNTASNTLQIPQPGKSGGHHSRHPSYNATSVTQATNLIVYANPGCAAIDRVSPSWCTRFWAACCCCCARKPATPVKKDRPVHVSSDSPLLSKKQPGSGEL